MDKALELITEHASRGAKLREEFFSLHAQTIRDAAFKTALSLARGGKLLLCGNGGSAADAQHVAAEFVNRFLLDRPALPALALTTDTSLLTAIANDSDYNLVFARQVEAFGKNGDILFAISTSGNSGNVIEALKTARERGLLTIGLGGEGGGAMAPLCDILVDVPSKSTPLIQEASLAMEHVYCLLTDYFLFENPGLLAPYLD